MRKYLILLVALALACAGAPAWGQQAGLTPVQQSPSRLDACTAYAYATGTQGTQITATIPAQAGQFVYICSISADLCANATGGTAVTNANFTSTNLPSSPTWQTTFAGTANLCATVKPIQEQFNGPPLKSLIPGTAVTIVSPAGSAQNLYTIRITYYYAP